jgi:hypothetical protein
LPFDLNPGFRSHALAPAPADSRHILHCRQRPRARKRRCGHKRYHRRDKLYAIHCGAHDGVFAVDKNDWVSEALWVGVCGDSMCASCRHVWWNRNAPVGAAGMRYRCSYRPLETPDITDIRLCPIPHTPQYAVHSLLERLAATNTQPNEQVGAPQGAQTPNGAKGHSGRVRLSRREPGPAGRAD